MSFNFNCMIIDNICQCLERGMSFAISLVVSHQAYLEIKQDFRTFFGN